MSSLHQVVFYEFHWGSSGCHEERKDIAADTLVYDDHHHPPPDDDEE